MRIQEIMTKDVSVIHPESSLLEAAEKMRDEDVGVLPVFDGDKIEGMITDRDIVVRAVAMNKMVDVCKVRDIMTDDVVYVYEDQEVQEAAEMMNDQRVGRLIVLNRDKELVGVVSRGRLTRQGLEFQEKNPSGRRDTSGSSRSL